MENIEMKFCQSCTMPMTKPEDFGIEKDGLKNDDYCHYCYENGAFKKEETMQEMIETCIPFAIEAGAYKDADTARQEMNKLFKDLKRWAK